MSAALQKLVRLSEDSKLKEQIIALEAGDVSTVRRIQKEYGPEPQLVVYQMATVVELTSLLALSVVKTEGQRRVIVESSKSGFMAAISRVAFLAQKTRDASVKAWCEQAQISFAELSGSSEFIKKSPSPRPREPEQPQPSVTQEGHKWIIKGYAKQAEPVNVASLLQLEAGSIPQQTSLLFCDCADAVFQIDAAKVTTVQMDKCVGVGVIINGDIIASAECVNSRKCQLQASGHLPAITVDSCDALTIYLMSPASKDVSIITSRSSELNVVHPVNWSLPKKTVTRTEKRPVKKDKPEADGEDARMDGDSSAEEEMEEIEVEDLVDDDDSPLETCEIAIPVQFKSFFDPASNKLVTEPVQHSGN